MVTKKLRAAVIGVGYLGRYHAQKYAEFDDVELVGVADVDERRAAEIAAQFGVPGHSDYRNLFDRAELVSIAVPTEAHYAVARDCLAAGLHILVEKPVTETVEQAEELIALANQNARVFQVGHLERFNPALTALKGILRAPLFIESHRMAPFKPRGLDVNVVLDLMIHDIDLILNAVKSPLAELRATGAAILTDDVDIANARMEFENGCVANVTASRISREQMRKIRVFQSSDYISIDFLERKISIVRKGKQQFEVENKTFAQVDALKNELRAFVDAVKNTTPPAVSGADGKRALEVALKITEQMGMKQEAVGGRR
ncbi:MAG: Gfo/Idh/MocA family oxidoreductase [Burkholderiales bacterium]